MPSVEDFTKLNQRLAGLNSQHAVLVDREEQKNTQRAAIEAELKAAGVDFSDPQAAIKTLETEIDQIFADSKAKVDAFEGELNAASAGGETSDLNIG